mmetsp:Transcript_22614/g.3728  ORF Transcript_22614/g.3728 Transcript_22614/m.3728 type:complete len:101 (+) Transcript_22614:1620-1922(+)
MFSGLSVICNGSSVEKLYSAFNLYDTSGDGIIQFDELVHYFHAIFSVILSNINDKNLKVERLAAATAKNALNEMEQDIETGGLTFEQFRLWFENSSLLKI